METSLTMLRRCRSHRQTLIHRGTIFFGRLMPVVNYPTSPKPNAVHPLGYGHQRWCHRCLRDHEDYRSQKKRQQKADGRGNRGQAGAAARLDPSGAFNVADNGGGTDERTDNGGDGICNESTADPWDVAVRIHDPRATRHSDQRADIVEHIHQQESQDDWQRLEVLREEEIKI